MAKVYNNIILGGGASGLMLAVNLDKKKETLIIEHNSKLGAKVLVSGGGRCNYTNRRVNSSNYLAKKDFISSILKSFSNRYIDNYFKRRGLDSVTKNSHELFCKGGSKDLLDILLKETRATEVKLNCKILSVDKGKDIFFVKTSCGLYRAKNLVVATGGLSFTKLGASDIGYKIAKSFGHTIKTPSAALVGFTLQTSESFFKELSGISLDVVVKVENRELIGSLLFAHRGVTGPVILNSSLYWQKGHLEIDFLPDINIETLLNSGKSISNLLPIPKRATKAFLDKLNLKDKSAKLLTKSDISRLKELKKYKFAPAGTFGYSKAEVTKGGIDVDEIEALTLESKKVKNLYFLGEVLDVTGELGGYNFTFAFAPALCCAKELN